MKSRKTIRLQGYDYAQDGWYFITICTFQFEEIFGEIDENSQFLPSKLGEIVKEKWLETSKIRPNVYLDTFQVMPNHFHAIVVIGGKNTLPNIEGFPNTNDTYSSFSSPKRTVGAIVRGFKGSVTKEYNKINDKSIATIWQSNYYERIIRNLNELNSIRNYIEKNPINWQKDKESFKKLLLKMNK